MLYAKDFRRMAYDSLNNKWGVAIGTGFVASLLGGYNTSNLANPRIQQRFHSQFGQALPPWIVGFIAIAFIWVIAIIIVGGAASFGYSKFNLNLVDRKETRFSDLFSQFNRIGAGFCMRFLMGLYCFLWTLLLIIPGIIASYSYAMTPYIMAENPNYGANEAIGYSKQLMEGNKWRLFCMWLSFIGWGLLCILTFGIGFLWFIPYKEAATAVFYREISGYTQAAHI